MKDNIKKFQGALGRVGGIESVKFTWDTEHEKIRNNERIKVIKRFTGKSYGFIAQELEKVVPELVFSDNDGFKSVAYGQMVTIGIGAIQEQQKIIDSLIERIKKHKLKVGG
jgi:hypothetical protein